MTPDQLLSATQKGLCAASRLRLGEGEHVLSRQRFPGLYAGSLTPLEKKRVHEVVDAALAAALVLRSAAGEVREHIRQFLLILIGQIEELRERCLHVYLFLFWEELRTADGQFPASKVIPSELFFECQPNGYNHKFEKRIIGILAKSSVGKCDLVGVSSSQRTIYLFEVKHGRLDDRGVGQILKYFSAASSVIDYADHRCDLRYIRPVLIVQDVSLPQWEAFARPFRELLDIYSFRVEGGELHLSCTRKRLSTELRKRGRFRQIE